MAAEPSLTARIAWPALSERVIGVVEPKWSRARSQIEGLSSGRVDRERDRRLLPGGGGEQLAPHPHQHPLREAIARLRHQAAQDHGLARRAHGEAAIDAIAFDLADRAHHVGTLDQQIDDRAIDPIDFLSQVLQGRLNRFH